MREPSAAHEVVGERELHLLYGDGVSELPAMVSEGAIHSDRVLSRKPKGSEFDPVAWGALVLPERPSVGSLSPDCLGRS